MERYAIIVAGGTGSRLGNDIPKQFKLLNSLPMLAHSLLRFYQADRNVKIFLVLPSAQIGTWENIVVSKQIPHTIIAGGPERFHSVKNALNAIENIAKADSNSVVAIHDAARPLVSEDLIKKTFEEAEKNGSAIPMVEIPFSIRKKAGNKWLVADRKNYCNIQTPQVFNLEKLFAAYRQEYVPAFTDDASVYEATGNEISLIEGEDINIKVTTAADLEWADWKLRK